MRTVFTTREIGHIFASQSQDVGRAGSIRFSGPTFYSYAEPIGQFVDDGKMILINDRTFSVTTTRHQGILRGAVSHIPQILVGYISKWQQDGEDDKNEGWYREEIETALAKAARAKLQHMIDWHRGRAERLIDSMTEYVRIFKLDWAIPTIPADLAELRGQLRKEAAEESARTKVERAERLKKTLEAEAIWLRGASVPYGLSLDYKRPTLLRIKGDEVETSRGARFPIAHARKGLALVKSVLASGGEWSPNGHTLHLGPYTVRHIAKDGTVTAGCHVVPYSSIEAIAPQLEKENLWSESK